MQAPTQNKLNSAQLNLSKSFQYLRNKQQISEIDSLINFYVEKKLDEALTKTESEKNYGAGIYDQWLKNIHKHDTKGNYPR
jgi:hypothetical protein